MGKRYRLEGHVWLDWVGEEANRERREVWQPNEHGIAAAMIHLIHHYRLLLTIDQEIDTYRVRCYPAENARTRGLPFFAASYSSTDLRRALSAAWTEYDMAMGGEAHYELTNREVQRWIA